MCLGAIYWARPATVYFAAGRGEAARAGFDDEFIYAEIGRAPGDRRIRMHRVELAEAKEPFRVWNARQDRVDY